ncbi:MAG: hypothetical protein DDG58_14050 [Ardenticatenia bacterium]|nr:MAG: hypothetical protein DDG58_14050 [Ardenticatenia bacterium]
MLWRWMWGGLAWLLLVACGTFGGPFGFVREDISLPVAITAVPDVTREAERLVPTAAFPLSSGQPSAEDISPRSEGIAPEVTLRTTGLWTPRQRIGVGVPYPPVERYETEQLSIGWYHAWRVLTDLPASLGVETWQMVRASENGFAPSREVIVAAARRYPGSIWLIGNEPDVIWQDNVTPERYAQVYHDVYHLLKEADPTCRVAAGGISQPTPLRLKYLERVLQAYQERYGEPMPVEMWHIHNFILREKRGSWGVDIPPGLDEEEGVLVEVQDNDNLSIFQEQVIAFRRWMAERGERDKPLVISEYGIPMPMEYGFDFARVRRFMTATMDFLLVAADPQLGYKSDGYRLVQRWAWFSMGDTRYPTGNLADLETGELTPLGKALGAYIRRFP